MKLFTLCIIVILIITSNMSAQKIETDKKKSANKQGVGKVYSPQASGDKLKISNSTGDSIMTITNEGTFELLSSGNDVGALFRIANKDKSNFFNIFPGRENDTSPFIAWRDNEPLRFATMNDLSFANFTERMRISNTGLELYGQIKITGGLPGAGKVLTSDADGLGSWQTFSGGASSINELSDAIHFGSNLFLGLGAGINYVQNSALGNLAVGYSALNQINSGDWNTAIGSYALTANTLGSLNTANGYNALYSNIGGDNNTANGYFALSNNTNGNVNTAIGVAALANSVAGSYGVAIGARSQFNANNSVTSFDNSNTSVGYESLRGSINASANTGNSNSAFGYQTLLSNSTGAENTAAGFQALYSNTTGSSNTATGRKSLLTNNTGSSNTANGYNALYSNTDGNYNTANGRDAMYFNIGGNYNTANGYLALYENETGTSNTATGVGALSNNKSGNENTAVGSYALQTSESGNGNTAVGFLAGWNFLTHFNTTSIGASAVPSASNEVRIGNSSVTVINGAVPWSYPSDGRYKFNLQENVSGLDFIMGLRPVSYNLDVNGLAEKLQENYTIDENNNRIRKTPSPEIMAAREERAGKREIGFVAQEVEQLVNELGIEFSGVVAPQNEESIYKLSYSQFVVPLVKGMQEQQEMIKELRAEIDELKRK